MLLVPYFKDSEHLGVSRYGFAMTILALGIASGSLLLSVINIKKKDKFKLFVLIE